MEKRPCTHPLLVSLLIFLLPLSTGCVQTRLPLSDLLPEVLDLTSNVEMKSIYLEVEAKPEVMTIGHQYLFFIIPFGTVSVEDPAGLLYTQVVQDLALAGYRAQLSTAPEQFPKLHITLNELQATAYDFLALRRIVCSTDWHVIYSRSATAMAQHFSVSGSSTSFRRFAFERELSFHLNKALTAASEEMLINMSLKK